MTITVTAVAADIPLKRSDVHAQTLHDEIAAKVGDKFNGVTVRDGQWAVAHVQTTLDPKLEADIKEALTGYEARILPGEARRVTLDDLRGRYSAQVMDIIEDVDPLKRINSAIVIAQDVIAFMQTPLIQDSLKAYGELTQGVRTFDIRLKMLKELQAKFGDKVKDLALLSGDAFVTVVGDYDTKHVEAIHEVVGKHDKSKAPPPEPDPQVLLIQTVQRIEAQIAALIEEVNKLKGKAAKA